MLRINIQLIISIVVLDSYSSELYDELYRPQLTFSPPSGWINDPNGLVYYDGVFHLFCQYNPNSTLHGNLHWYHAISPDLVHWENLGIALAPTNGNLIFSGSAIIDHGNVTGLQANDDKKTLIAIFTAHDLSTNEENQWLAYSNDGPEYRQFEMYKNNPILPNPNPSEQKDFRDPAVFKYNDHFVLVLAAYNRILIYNSPDLLKWTFVSEFGVDEGSHTGTWECPSLFPINVTIDGVQVEKYVLIVGLTDNSIPTTQYYVGSFDGQTFTNENSKETILWLDYGPDSYAGITYNQLPDGRRIFISWENRWQYAQQLNFNVWNGQMGLARELTLNKIDNRILISSLPVRETKMLRIDHVRKQNIPIENYLSFEIAKFDDENRKQSVDIEMMLNIANLKAGDSFNIVFFGVNDALNISFNGNEFILDRSKAGRIDFPNFGRLWNAPRMIESSILKLRIIIDRSSIEFFADDGLTVMTALFYSEEDIASKMVIQVHSASLDSMIAVKEFNVYKMKSIWK
uniref:MDL5 n=1 Tax=Mayetiola destructor TaxID=39758 RepID=A0A7S5VKC9_MAYDE|nr:MDL5 [Mayetiola destructor]